MLSTVKKNHNTYELKNKNNYKINSKDRYGHKM